MPKGPANLHRKSISALNSPAFQERADRGAVRSASRRDHEERLARQHLVKERPCCSDFEMGAVVDMSPDSDSHADVRQGGGQ